MPPRAHSEPPTSHFVELLGRSSFSFLRGASRPEEMVERASALGMPALGLCDRNGLYGTVRAMLRAKELGLRLHAGAELALMPWRASGRLLQSKHEDELRQQRKQSIKSFDAKRASLPTLSCLPRSLEGYQSLCRLLTASHSGLDKGLCFLEWEFLERFNKELTLLVPVDLEHGHTLIDWLGPLTELCKERVELVVTRHLDGLDGQRAQWARAARQRFGLQICASARPLFHDKARKPLADIMHCIREGTSLERAGSALHLNAEAFLRSEEEMLRLFREEPSWVYRTGELSADLRFDLSSLRYEFPCQLEPQETADQKLQRLSSEGAKRRYPDGVPDKVSAQIKKELRLIEQLQAAPYFLCTWEIIEIARERRILCQGRGSAANSAVCYVLGITAVDPARSNLLFERFLSAERNEPPDIDIDFEHERREEVIQELYRRYGREHAAMVSEVVCYRGKSALREVGKAFGLSLEQVDQLCKSVTHWDSAATAAARLEQYGFDGRDQRLQQVVHWADELSGFPRHLSVHVGGFVLSKTPLYQVAPVEPAAMKDRTVVPWDKDDIEALGFFKVDVLALGMLTAIRKCAELIHQTNGAQCPVSEDDVLPPWVQARTEHVVGELSQKVSANTQRVVEGELSQLDREAKLVAQVFEARVGNQRSTALLADASPTTEAAAPQPPAFDPLDAVAQVPAEDPSVYALVSEADTVGVFQIESRAQMAMLPRLRPQRFYDLVIEVAIVRPGPIQGGMVHPYLRRRNGEEAVTVPHPELAPILKRTLGVPLFQEQVMQIAITGAGYTGGEADQLRRDMAAWKKSGRLLRHKDKLLRGFSKKSIPEEFGLALFEQIKGFGDYGFPESHAASFALLVYLSAWQKAHYPAHFTAALLNSQPMGFYSPSSIVRDAQKHHVQVRPVCVQRSHWDCTLERIQATDTKQGRLPPKRRAYALRLGLRLVKGLGQDSAQRVVKGRPDAGYASVEDFARRTGLRQDEIDKLAQAGSLSAIQGERRQVLWQSRAWRGEGLFASAASEEVPVRLPAMSKAEQLMLDYSHVGLSLGDHPICHYRESLNAQGVLKATTLADVRNNSQVRVAGMVLSRQRPSTASGVVFITLEDESGVANVVVFSKIFEQHEWIAKHSTLLVVEGKVERQITPRKPGEVGRPTPVIHLIAKTLHRLDDGKCTPQSKSRDFH